MSKEGTNYRNVYKSDHLGVVDLEEFIERGMQMIFTIKEVKQLYGVKVAGKQIDANIAYFKEDIKPLVVNSGNGDILKALTGSVMVENWKNIKVELYIDPTAKLKGQIVGGVRIRNQKIENKETMTPTHKLWDKLQEKQKENGTTIDQIRVHYNITQENYDLLCG